MDNTLKDLIDEIIHGVKKPEKSKVQEYIDDIVELNRKIQTVGKDI